MEGRSPQFGNFLEMKRTPFRTWKECVSANQPVLTGKSNSQRSEIPYRKTLAQKLAQARTCVPLPHHPHGIQPSFAKACSACTHTPSLKSCGECTFAGRTAFTNRTEALTYRKLSPLKVDLVIDKVKCKTSRLPYMVGDCDCHSSIFV